MLAIGEVIGFLAWSVQGTFPLSGIITSAAEILVLCNRQILLIGCLCSVATEINALLYILMHNVRALNSVPMAGNAELITLLAQSMNQVPVQGQVPFNIIEP